MAPSVAVAEKMVRSCRKAKVPFFIHENWRWQTTIREFKRVLASGEIGPLFRARIRMVSGFPVFKNEPTLSELENFILTDMGTHILDVARFLFGEAQTLYCQVHRVHPDIKGEDVATVMMLMGGQTTVVCELGYPENYLENDVFPQTLIFVEGEKGSAELGEDYWVRVTTSTGTHSKRFPPGTTLGPIRITWSFIPASCRATPICCRRCGAKAGGNDGRRQPQDHHFDFRSL